VVAVAVLGWLFVAFTSDALAIGYGRLSAGRWAITWWTGWSRQVADFFHFYGWL
jgi:hypothetical protein